MGEARLFVAVLGASLGAAIAASESYAQPVPADFAGIHASDHYVQADEARRRRAMAAQARAGAGLVRVWFSWRRMEVAPDRYDLSPADRVVEEAARNGIRVLPVLLYSPRFRSSFPGAGYDSYPPAQPADMARFAAVMVGRYGSEGTFWDERPWLPRLPIRSWQIWNEPNISPWWRSGPDAGEYTRLLRTVAADIRGCDARAEVVAAGLPNSHSHLGMKVVPYLDAMYRAGARGAFDAFAIHPYGEDVIGVLRQVREAREVMRRHGDRAPIWVTEFGWGSGHSSATIDVGEERQAELIAATLHRLYAERDTLGIRGFVYYHWGDARPIGPDSVWFHIGLVGPEEQEKPALFAFRDVVAGADRLPANPEPPPAGAERRCSAASLGVEVLPAGAADAGEELAGGCLPGRPCRPPPRISRVRLRPERFRPAKRGSPVRRAARPCRRCARRGTRLSFRASRRATLEIRFELPARRVAVPATVRIRVRGGVNRLWLSGRVRRRPLATGRYRLRVQLVDAAGVRSRQATRRFTIVR